jgi:hypothetical protein
LLGAGLHLADPAGAASEVEVTFSENLESYLWVASIHLGTETRVVMRAVPRKSAPAMAAAGSSVLLRKTLLWSQAAPILDAAAISAGNPGAQLLVLDTEKASVLHGSPGHWELDQSLPITHARAFPRDVRGRLELGGDRLFRAYLPGTACSASATGPFHPSDPTPGLLGTLQMNCQDTDEPWPLQPGTGQAAAFAAARNFFTGALEPALGKQTATAPFYSAAGLPRPNYTLWLFAGVDGRVRATDGINEIVLGAASHWGSEIAAVKSECGTMVLASADADDAASDTVRTYEVADREPAPSSPALEFPGPVTALWSSSQEGTATAVAHNLRTNQYEAYSVAVLCP